MISIFSVIFHWVDSKLVIKSVMQARDWKYDSVITLEVDNTFRMLMCLSCVYLEGQGIMYIRKSVHCCGFTIIISSIFKYYCLG